MENNKKIIYIDGMSCNHCKMTVEKVLKELSGVKKVEVDLGKKEAIMEADRKAQNKFILIFLITALLKSIADATSSKLFFINTTSADSIAISVPEPIPIPTSAFASAGLSFIPSPW